MNITFSRRARRDITYVLEALFNYSGSFGLSANTFLFTQLYMEISLQDIFCSIKFQIDEKNR